jgi:hypothetical protein
MIEVIHDVFNPVERIEQKIIQLHDMIRSLQCLSQEYFTGNRIDKRGQ